MRRTNSYPDLIYVVLTNLNTKSDYFNLAHQIGRMWQLKLYSFIGINFLKMIIQRLNYIQ